MGSLRASPTSVAMRHIARSPFNLLKELWISFHGRGASIPLDFPALELLVVGREPSLLDNLGDMLAPQEGVVPSPRIATIELRGGFYVTAFAC